MVSLDNANDLNTAPPLNSVVSLVSITSGKYSISSVSSWLTFLCFLPPFFCFLPPFLCLAPPSPFFFPPFFFFPIALFDKNIQTTNGNCCVCDQDSRREI